MKRLLPYALPIISILVIFGVLMFNPNITGFAVKDYDIEIKISTYPNLVVPEDTIVEVTLDGVSKTMTFKEFIDKTGDEYRLVEGSFEDINYQGKGYSGRYDYYLSAKEFGFENLEVKTLTVRVSYENYLISESVVPIK
jgi:hypothetical protein